MTIPSVKLTALASAAGCAAKLGAGDLSELVLPLAGLFQAADHPNVLVGLGEPDDAGVMKLNAEQAIIMTTDFFPPVVDDPYWYGAIAAANAMSDVYAMGGSVLMALNLAAFPASQSLDILREILRGGADKVKESGGVLIGGHTIMDEEPKYGLAVVGLVHPDKIITKQGAQAGDLLVLTKPLGVGIINTALKQGRAKEEHVTGAMLNMAALNRMASELAPQYETHAMTDITGFSLMGHAYEMVRGTELNIRIAYENLFWLAGVDEYAAQGIFPGGMGRNRAFYKKWVDLSEDLTGNAEVEGRLYDPQTSGGLLMAIPAHQAENLVSALRAGSIQAGVIGEVVTGAGRVVVQ